MAVRAKLSVLPRIDIQWHGCGPEQARQTGTVSMGYRESTEMRMSPSNSSLPMLCSSEELVPQADEDICTTRDRVCLGWKVTCLMHLVSAGHWPQEIHVPSDKQALKNRFYDNQHPSSTDCLPKAV